MNHTSVIPDRNGKPIPVGAGFHARPSRQGNVFTTPDRPRPRTAGGHGNPPLRGSGSRWATRPTGRERNPGDADRNASSSRQGNAFTTPDHPRPRTAGGHGNPPLRGSGTPIAPHTGGWWRAAVAVCLITVCATLATAQDADTTPATPPKPPTCDLAEHRQFDFWIGEWVVTNRDETAAGENVIERVLDGCALHESWTSASGTFRGHSYSIYSRAKGKWHQTWVDTTGNLLEIEGGIVDGKMVLEGEGRGRDGAPITNRITWTPNTDGSVRQHWQVSSDGGKIWTDAFDGLYKKKNKKK